MTEIVGIIPEASVLAETNVPDIIVSAIPSFRRCHAMYRLIAATPVGTLE